MSITLTLIAYLQGLITLDVLPNALSLEQEVWETMDELWERSVSRISEGVVVEWGGLIELKGSHLRLVNPVSGTATGLRLLIPQDKHFVGSFHTHPNAAGYTGIGFSGADFADMANQGERISLVQSGQHIFMLLRTRRTPKGLDVDEWRSRMDKLFEQAYRNRQSILGASLVANQTICQQLGLALYYGHSFGRLVEVWRP